MLGRGVPGGCLRTRGSSAGERTARTVRSLCMESKGPTRRPEAVQAGLDPTELGMPPKVTAPIKPSPSSRAKCCPSLKRREITQITSLRAKYRFSLEGQKICILLSRACVVQKRASVVHGHRVKTQQRWFLLCYSVGSLWDPCDVSPFLKYLGKHFWLGESASISKRAPNIERCLCHEAMPAISEMASNARNLSPDKSQPVQRCVHSLLPPHTRQLSLRLFMGRQHQALLRAGTTPLGAFWVQGKNSGLSSYRLRSPCCSYCSSFPRKAESGKNFPLFS